MTGVLGTGVMCHHTEHFKFGRLKIGRLEHLEYLRQALRWRQLVRSWTWLLGVVGVMGSPDLHADRVTTHQTIAIITHPFVVGCKLAFACPTVLGKVSAKCQ